MSKQKLLLWLMVSISITGCEIYNAFQRNKIIIAFLQNKLNKWIAKEHQIMEKYNNLIIGEKFSSEILWKELNKTLIPETLKLREEIENTEVKDEELLKIKRMFVKSNKEKKEVEGLLDLMLEGFDLIKEGLKKKKDNDSYSMIFRGRDKLKIVDKYHRLIELEVHKLMKKYYIKAEKNNRQEKLKK